MLLLLSVILMMVEAHIYRDHWMNTNGIDPDFLHAKAMAAMSRAKVVEVQLHQHGHVSAMASRSVQAYDFGEEITIFLPRF